MQQIWLSVTSEEFRALVRSAVADEIRDQLGKAVSTPAEEEYYTTNQAKIFLKCSTPTLLKWRKEKFITAKFFGRSVRYLKSDLIKISQSRKSK